MKNSKSIFLLGCLCLFATITFAQLAKFKTHTKNAIGVDISSVFGKNNTELAFHYDRRIAKRWSFRLALHVLKSNNTANIRLGTYQYDYTEHEVQECTFILFLPFCQTNTYYTNGQPSQELNDVYKSKSAGFLRSGAVFYLNKDQSKFVNSGFYVGIDLITGVQTFWVYNSVDHYNIIETEEEVDFSGIPLLAGSYSVNSSNVMEQRQTISRKKSNDFIFGMVHILGVRIPLGKRCFINLEGQFGLVGSPSNGNTDLGWATPNGDGIYRRVSTSIGFTF